MLVELILLTDKGSGDKIDIIFGKLLTLTNSDGRQLMSFGTLDAKSKELVLDILLSIISSSYTKMKYAMFFCFITHVQTGVVEWGWTVGIRHLYFDKQGIVN